MPRQVTRFLCDRCLKEHLTFEAALGCESLPMAPQRFLEGMAITFELEEQMFSRWSYTSRGGTVLYAFPTLKNDGTAHIWVYIVSCTDRAYGPQEYEVLEIEGRLLSPSGHGYNSGYAADVRNSFINVR